MAPVTCTRPGCGNTGYLRGVCVTHYDKWVEAGYTKRVPIEQVAAHVAALQADGWSIRELVAATGVNRVTMEILAGQSCRTGQKSVLQSTAQKIYSLPLGSTNNHGRARIPATGTIRRMRALSWQGWPLNWQAQQCGLYSNTLKCINNRNKKTVTANTARKVTDLYNKYSMRPGPNADTARKARAKGWHPPLAWDDDEIDNPKARPRRVRRRIREN